MKSLQEFAILSVIVIAMVSTVLYIIMSGSCFFPTIMSEPGNTAAYKDSASLGVTWDYFQLVMQYQPYVCQFSLKRGYLAPPNEFSIHGLWPSNTAGWPGRCPNHPLFDINQVSAAQLNLLNQHWPDVIHGQNVNFWSHEWNKHGTCSESTYLQPRCFDIALVHGQTIGPMLTQKITATGTMIYRSTIRNVVFA